MKEVRRSGDATREGGRSHLDAVDEESEACSIEGACDMAPGVQRQFGISIHRAVGRTESDAAVGTLVIYIRGVVIGGKYIGEGACSAVLADYRLEARKVRRIYPGLQRHAIREIERGGVGDVHHVVRTIEEQGRTESSGGRPGRAVHQCAVVVVARIIIGGSAAVLVEAEGCDEVIIGNCYLYGSGGGEIADGIACACGKVVHPVAGCECVPVCRKGGGEVFCAEADAIEQELYAHHANVVGGACVNSDRARNRAAIGRRRDVHEGRFFIHLVIDVYQDCSRGSLIACGVPGDGGELMAAIAHGGGAPAKAVGCSIVFGSKVGAIQLELHACHAGIVAGICGDIDGAGDIPGGRRRDVHGGRFGIRFVADVHVGEDLGGAEQAAIVSYLVDRSVDGFPEGLVGADPCVGWVEGGECAGGGDVAAVRDIHAIYKNGKARGLSLRTVVGDRDVAPGACGEDIIIAVHHQAVAAAVRPPIHGDAIRYGTGIAVVAGVCVVVEEVVRVDGLAPDGAPLVEVVVAHPGAPGIAEAGVEGEVCVVGDAEVVVAAIEAKGLTVAAGGPGRAIHECAGMSIAGPVGGAGAGSLIEAKFRYHVRCGKIVDAQEAERKEGEGEEEPCGLFSIAAACRC